MRSDISIWRAVNHVFTRWAFLSTASTPPKVKVPLACLSVVATDNPETGTGAESQEPSLPVFDSVGPGHELSVY